MFIMNEKKAIDLMKMLVEIPSPSGGEAAIAKALKELMEKAGFDQVVIDEFYNVVGTIDSGKKGDVFLLFNHSDSGALFDKNSKANIGVFEGKKFGKENRCFSGPGAAAPKAAIVSMLLTANDLISNKEKFRGKVKVAFATKDLFCNHDGVKEVAPLIKDADFAITAEPSDITIVTGARGILQIEVTLFGQSGHWAAPNRDKNVFYQLATFLCLLKKESVIMDKDFGPTGFNPVKIEYSASAPMIPDTVKILVDRRLLPNDKNELFIKTIKNIVAEVSRIYNSTKGNVRVTSNMYPLQTDDLEEHLKTLEGIANRVLGYFPKRGPIKCATNAAFIRKELNIPALVLGAGNLQDMGVNEHVEIETILQAAQIYYEFILDYLNA